MPEPPLTAYQPLAVSCLRATSTFATTTQELLLIIRLWPNLRKTKRWQNEYDNLRA